MKTTFLAVLCFFPVNPRDRGVYSDPLNLLVILLGPSVHVAFRIFLKNHFEGSI